MNNVVKFCYFRILKDKYRDFKICLEKYYIELTIGINFRFLLIKGNRIL